MSTADNKPWSRLSLGGAEVHHFSTRSRRYSTTLGELRAAREQHARDNDITTGRLPLLDEDTVLVISEWEYTGKGHSLGDQLLVAALTGTSLPTPQQTAGSCP